MITHTIVILESKSNEDKVKVTNLKDLPKFHTILSADGQTDKVKPVYPFNFFETGV